MGAIFYYFILLTQVTVIFTALPPIQKCKLSDSDCLKKSSQNALLVLVAGIPELGIEVLDPGAIDVIKIDFSGLDLTVTDVSVKGLKNSVIDKISFDDAKKQLELTFHVAPITVKGKYKASGNLLILPITGDGDMTIKIQNLEIAMTMSYDIVKDKNGKDVIELKNYKYTFDAKENTHFKLTNLFNGNKQLSDAMHSFVNENWKPVALEFGGPMLKKPMQKVFTVIKTYLQSQPLEDIAIV